jgi:hypothetical protein
MILRWSFILGDGEKKRAGAGACADAIVLDIKDGEAPARKQVVHVIARAFLKAWPRQHRALKLLGIPNLNRVRSVLAMREAYQARG